MALIINNIRLPIGAGDEAAMKEALRKLKLGQKALRKIYIAKSSADFRHRDNPVIVYSVGVELESVQEEEAAARAASGFSITLRQKKEFSPVPGTCPMKTRPVITGFGPAGMFAGLMLSRAGYRPLILERGADVDSRVRDVKNFWDAGKLDAESNVQFGEGGAGTFSDGKLVTRINDPLCETVLAEFVHHGAPESVERLAKPHIGTDNLRKIGSPKLMVERNISSG